MINQNTTLNRSIKSQEPIPVLYKQNSTPHESIEISTN